MKELRTEIEIDASPERVWEVLADFGGVSNWAPTITESRSLTEANEGVGAERTCDHVKMGTLEERIVDWEEGERYAYIVTKGLPMPMKSLKNDWSTASANGATRVDLKMVFETKFGPLGRMMEAMLLRRMMRKEMAITLAGLKYHVETGKTVTTEVEDDLPISAVV